MSIAGLNFATGKALFIFVLALLSYVFPVRAEHKVTIVATPDVRPVARLLATALAGTPGLTISEWPNKPGAVEIPADAEVLALGKKSGADGVVLLGLTKVGEYDVITMRCVAAEQAVVVATGRGQWPLEKPEAWAKSAAREIIAVLPKLGARNGEATPVSVVGFRTSRTTPGARETEEALRWLFVHRLSLEPTVFVMEREQLDTVIAASPLAKAFWRGRWLLDGSIDEDPADSSKLTLRMRLVPPLGGQVLEMSGAADRAKLPRAVDALAKQMLVKFGAKPGGVTWDPGSEAARFLKVAQDRGVFGEWPEALMAAESSWALGERNADLVTLRIRGAIFSVHPKLLRRISGYYGGFHLDHDAQSLAPHMRSGFDRPGVLTAAEAERSATSILRGFDLLSSHFDSIPPKLRAKLTGEAVTIALTGLERAARQPATAPPAAQLAALRTQLDAAAERVFQTSHDVAETADLFLLKASLLPVWLGDPDAALAGYRALLSVKHPPELQASLRLGLPISAFPNFQVPVGEETPDRRNNRWDEIIAMLAASKAPEDRLAAASDPEKVKEALWDMRDGMARGEYPFSYFNCFSGGATGTSSGGGPGASGRPFGFKPKLAEDRDFMRRYLLHLCREGRDLELVVFNALLLPDDYTEEQASEMIAAMKEYRARTKAGWMRKGVDEQMLRLVSRFPALAAKPTAETLRVTRFWTPYALPQVVEGKWGTLGIDPRVSPVVGDALWTHVRFGTDDKPHDYLLTVSLPTLATRVAEVPARLGPRRTSWGANCLAVYDDFVFLTSDGWLRAFERKTNLWREFPAAVGVYETPLRAGPWIFAQARGEEVTFLQTDSANCIARISKAEPWSSSPAVGARLRNRHWTKQGR